MSKQNIWLHVHVWNACIHTYMHEKGIPIQEGRGLSQALLSPVIHFSVEAPCRVYPGSHLYVMLLPEKWPWSLTLKPNWGTPGSSQWDNSKPGEKNYTEKEFDSVLLKMWRMEDLRPTWENKISFIFVFKKQSNISLKICHTTVFFYKLCWYHRLC